MMTVYLCQDTITGIYSALYDAWLEKRAGEAKIALHGNMEPELFCEYSEVEEKQKKAKAIESLIRKYLGENAYEDIYRALLADDPEKANAVFMTMQEARRIKDSRRIMEHLDHPAVAKVFALSRRVANEAHYFIEFVRFRELKNGILFSEIAPKSQVLTCIGDHFANRFPLENFLIYDKTHRVFLLHEARKHWYLVWGKNLDEESICEISEQETEYEKLWKCFFHTIAVEERKNPVCQRSHLPLRFRTDMLEFDK
ncbi:MULTISPECIES: TIGR03915 family putative DNA repair protein [Lachnospiraceae]|jgi:probable DNA metabolism protein|uniref:TIGR03915 family putative DNA repair protein n=1 Tax=Faecalicatena acetigenes TaxID=2981790 RepID=A0ABT2TBM7_9FIRM|nr:MULTISPECIES: TIGR03915 family putative DNA repair protein [Lachnospiraceae]MCU6747616.1 TIGR03915 family putative DNA repair protein [Faecalicatena acetigenes]RGT73226.1 DNA metabolism protein [Ruminococcus sp. AF18-22]SCH99179.1 probable DNA metabolism protein [uncultured Clostridium sp.]